MDQCKIQPREHLLSVQAEQGELKAQLAELREAEEVLTERIEVRPCENNKAGNA